MSIICYKESDQTFWKAYVHLRSKKDRKLRVQKTEFKISSEAKAKAIERKLRDEAVLELNKKEGIGVTWGDVLDRWEDAIQNGTLKGKTEKTAYDYLGSLRKWTDIWINKPVDEFDIRDGNDVFSCLEEEKKSFNYRKKIKREISSVLNWAYLNRVIDKECVNPVQGISFTKKETVPQILKKEEITKFLNCAQQDNHPWYPIWFTALYTGMRSGELYTLTWENVDMNEKQIRVNTSYDRATKTFGPTKSRYERIVPMSKKLYLLFKDLHRKTNGKGFVLPRFLDWDRGEQAKVLRLYLENIGIKPVVFHALRACWTTNMLSNGVPSSTVMAIGGWRDLKTMQIYVRLAGIEVKGATENLTYGERSGTFIVKDHVIDYENSLTTSA